ncbi:MAG: class I adenylate-forming enzyme family protein [Acidimicrobiia bacterium]
MTLSEMLRAAVERAPDTAAVITERERVTFGELWTRVEERAAQIASITEPGARVAVVAENCTEYVVLYYAIPHAGRILVPLNHRLHPEEWRATLERSSTTVLCGERALLERCDTPVDHVIAFDQAPPSPAFVSFNALSVGGLKGCPQRLV